VLLHIALQIAEGVSDNPPTLREMYSGNNVLVLKCGERAETLVASGAP